MRQLNIASVDLNLLPPLAALLRRRNVTHAAADAGLSQPAMSRALGRLRALLGDPLLVRGTSGYVLTPRAAALQPRLEAMLTGIGEMLITAPFDPLRATRTVRLAAADSHTVGLIPALMARLAVEAPGINLQVQTYSADLQSRIESGAIDMAFATATTPLPPGSMSATLTDDRLTLVMRRDHPAAHREWTLKDYADWSHVGVALLGDGQSDIDAELAAAGVKRRIALVTPHFTAALATVAVTDMVTTVSETFARRFATAFDLVLKPPPLAAKELRLTLVWSHIRDTDPLLAWFRGLLAEVATALHNQ